MSNIFMCKQKWCWREVQYIDSKFCPKHTPPNPEKE